ncbi:hypothetical protein BDY19DRAFT_901037, partial [Irpex rosettiformis]
RSGARTRRERLTALQANWKEQMPQLVDAYLCWKHHQQTSPQTTDTQSSIQQPLGSRENTSAIDPTYRRKVSIVQSSGEAANVSLIRQGLLGCAPIDPAFAFSIDTLELYHRLRRRHPRLGIQAMMRALCDVHEVNYLDSYREQLSIAFDAYLDILRRVRQDVDHALGRDTPNWRIKNACPCCNYRLKDEPKLIPSRLLAMDGNNSAKRVASAGLVNFSTFQSDYFLSHEEVDRFKSEVKRCKCKDVPGNDPMVDSDSKDEDNGNDAPWLPDITKPENVTDEQVNTMSCTENWKASAEEHHRKVLDIYHQTGIFGSACHHHFIEKFCEIIRSSEL